MTITVTGTVAEGCPTDKKRSHASDNRHNVFFDICCNSHDFVPNVFYFCFELAPPSWLRFGLALAVSVVLGLMPSLLDTAQDMDGIRSNKVTHIYISCFINPLGGVSARSPLFCRLWHGNLFRRGPRRKEVGLSEYYHS